MPGGAPFGVSARMVELRDARRSAPTVLVGAYLVPLGNATHKKGAFAISTRVASTQHKASMHHTVDRLLERSPGLCAANVSLVVMHNVLELPPRSHVTHGPGPTAWCHRFLAPHGLSMRPEAHWPCCSVVRAPPLTFPDSSNGQLGSPHPLS